MENASKAILIAGGVLLAMVVISICMLVISNAREAFVSMEEKRQAQIVQEQTVKFANYVGQQDIYGTEVYNCIKRAESYNDFNPGNNITVQDPTNVDGIDVTVVSNRTIKFKGTMVTREENGTIESITFELP